MRILYVSTDYPEKGKPTTGFPNYLYRVSLALVQMGHEPIILSIGKKESYHVDRGIKIWTFECKYKDFKLQVLDYGINALKAGYVLNKKVKQIVERMSVDIIQFTSLKGIAMFYRGNTPAVLRLSSYAKTYFSSFQTFSPLMVEMMSFMERLSVRRCNLIFAPCEVTAIAFGKDCKRKVEVIETPFVNDVKEYDNKYIDRYLGDKKYVLFFGSLYAEKGVLVIADILEKFLQHNLQYYFVFVGDTYMINDENSAKLLKRKAGVCKDRVIIWNAIPHKQLYPIIKRADFVVLPSLMDNFPNACIEAMYFEKIVIGTYGASFEQLITHGNTGFLCEIGNCEDLLQKMEIVVLLSNEKKAEIGKQARKRIDKLKPEIVVKKLLRLYEYVISNTK